MERLKGLKILVVDDEPLIRELLVEDLTNEGAQVAEASSGFDGIKVCLDHTFDLVVSDVRMNDGSGIDLLKFLNDPSRKKPKVIFVTAQSNTSFEELYLLGADGIFSKPFEMEELIQNILRLSPPANVRFERNWDRFETNWEVEVTLPYSYKVIPAQMRNICLGGMGIHLVDEVPALGKEVLFRWCGLEEKDPNRALVGAGICRWIRAAENGFFYVGVEFKQTPASSLAWLIDRLKEVAVTGE